MSRKTATLGTVAIAALLALACGLWEEGTSPVAPTGTVLTVRANPTSISLFGASQLTVVALHSSGVPARTHTEIRLSTDLGSLAETLLRTNDQGSASTTLSGDGRAGTATVRASSGSLTPVEVRVTIAAAALAAAFTATVGPAPSLTVAFDDTSAGDPNEWAWSFGDGSSSSERDPVHTYGGAGDYLVTLTVRNPAGEDSVSRFVTVPAAAGSAVAAAAATGGRS